MLYEYYYINTYYAFSKFDKDNYDTNIKIFNEWVSSKKSYMSYAARGFYISGKAYDLRGSEYIHLTSESALKEARMLWVEALADLNKSIQINDKLIPSYARIIAITMSSGERSAAQAAIHKALVINPYLYNVRATYLEYLQPKWGGTYEEAEAFVEEAQKYGSKNPLIWNLRGTVPSMLAYQYQLDWKCDLAITKYTEALNYGERPSWLRNKAFNHYMLGDYKGAINTMLIVKKYVHNSDEQAAISSVIAALFFQLKHNPQTRPIDSLNSKGQYNGTLGFKDFTEAVRPIRRKPAK